MCSGYLYQKYSKVNPISVWENNVLKKRLTLGVPYFAFSIFTWCLKIIFSESVNEKVGVLRCCLKL
jgi:fucose 4-O-acetylase-like acetyltransferase